MSNYAELVERLEDYASAFDEDVKQHNWTHDYERDAYVAHAKREREAAAAIKALEESVKYWQADSAAAWDKCEERKKQAEKAEWEEHNPHA